MARYCFPIVVDDPSPAAAVPMDPRSGTSVTTKDSVTTPTTWRHLPLCPSPAPNVPGTQRPEAEADLVAGVDAFDRRRPVIIEREDTDGQLAALAWSQSMERPPRLASSWAMTARLRFHSSSGVAGRVIAHSGRQKPIICGSPNGRP